MRSRCCGCGLEGGSSFSVRTEVLRMVGSRSMAELSCEKGSWLKFVWMWLILRQMFWLLRFIPSSFCLRFWQISSLRLRSSSKRLIDVPPRLQLQLNILYNQWQRQRRAWVLRRGKRGEGWVEGEKEISTVVILHIQMDFINSRYSKRVQLDSFNVSRTSNFYNSLIRKQSAKTDILRPENKILPRLEPPQKHYFSRRVHLSTDMKNMKRSLEPEITTAQISLKREKLNLTRLGVSHEREVLAQKFAACTRQGRRSYNEDRFVCKVRCTSIYDHQPIFSSKNQPYDLFAVFDGHGGPNCAEFLKEHFPLLLARSKHLELNPELALRETFEKCEEKFLNLCEAKSGTETSGSCAVVCLIMGSKVIVANLGDSRALMLGSGSGNALELTRDHKPHETGEKLRIIKHGGKIYRQQEGIVNQIKLFRQMRVLPGNLNVTRTIGDAEVKLRKYGGLPGMISAVPDIASHEKQHYELLLLGSDGLFEAFSSEEIRAMYEQLGEEHEDMGREKLVRLFVETLCQEAEGKSSDNITAIVVLLQ